MYPGDDTMYARVKASGFNTLVLSSFYIRSNGDVFSGDDGRHPVIHDGRFVGDDTWRKRVAALKGQGSTINRVEILLEGRWYNQVPNTFDFIRRWADTTDLAGDTLQGICKALKDALGVDGLCIDDESVYDSPSIIRLGAVIQKLGMHMTLCPFRQVEYWKAVLDGSAATPGLIDAIYLQCYDGGSNNTPGPWVAKLGSDVPLYPIFMCRGSFGACTVTHGSESADSIRVRMTRFKKEYPGMNGGAIWQLADIGNYIRMDCAVKDPSSGGATTVSGFLEQLKDCLQAGLNDK
jgi:hypothetical protein